MDYALFAHEKLALLGLSCNAFPEAYNPRPHFDYISQRPSKKRGGKEYNDETHNTTRNPNNKNINNSKKNLRWRSKIPALIHMKPKETAEAICSKQLACAMQTRWHLNLQVNQLAKSDAIKLNKLSKTGIASAMIHARIQTANPIATQDPVAIQSRECMRSLLRKIRT